VTPVGGEARNSLALYESRVEGHQSVIYRNGAADFEMTGEDVAAVDYSRFGALITAGTVFAAEPSRAAAFEAFERARAAGLPILFDIDYRPYSWPSPEVASEVLSRAGAMADVIVGNDDEFGFMAGGRDKGLAKARELAASTAAIAARHAIEAHGLERVAVVDFDVHHGNGTQDVVEDDSTIFYASSHEGGIFPGTGHAHETGVGNIVNTPLDHGAGSIPFRAAYERTILPALDSFAPQLIIVSAGFDAHKADPLASLQLETEDFAWITERLCEAAASHCDRKLVSLLEGGYDLAALGESTAAHVSTLMTAARG